MASAHCTVFSLRLRSNNPIARRTCPLLVVVSSVPASNPTKVRLRHRRKNHLRPKILKTLTKSHPSIVPLLTQEPPLSRPHTTEVDDFPVEVPADGVPSESIAVAAGEGGELEESPASEMTGTLEEFNGISGKLSARSILKYSAILFGAFVLQTIFSVLITLDDDSKQKAGDSSIYAREKRNALFDGSGKTMRVASASGAIYLEDQHEMEKKIEEIKLMAREARIIEGEKEEKGIGYPESDDESAVSGHRLGIEKDIGARLLKLQDRVNSGMDKSAWLNAIKNLRTCVKSTGGVVRDDKNVNKGNGALTFKKKLKYKSPSTKPRKAPKVFQGLETTKHLMQTIDSSSKDKATAQDNRSTATDHVQISSEDKHVNQQDDETQETDSRLSLEDGGKLVDEEANTLLNTGKNMEELMARPNVGTGTQVKNNRTSNGGFPEDSFGMSSVEVIQSRKSKDLRTRNSLGIVEEDQDDNKIFEKGDVLSVNGNPKHGIADKVSAANNVKVKLAITENDMWWSNLRYVLVIIMRRGSDKEGPSGLYSLKITSQEEDQNGYSYIVAFEDDADANNFCFLLESFFEDLGDFSADAVPMSIQVKISTMLTYTVNTILYAYIDLKKKKSFARFEAKFEIETCSLVSKYRSLYWELYFFFSFFWQELHQAVKSHAKKVFVVKKRQLQLYAGQPLSDVEMTLCSLVEQHQNVRPADSK
ncbi:LOW QUALITY PROTEIN: uncharacterized protein LOC129308811 [Prosopis cineraria]|uniref:LOW QUALITY PROTEIN: uncharacterized protein LOC129308811 n=1 Tax=Prosopis cineraria TaxID=364024 RepID=UPI0024105F8B|nr:LOW QUALITY PROTEIN: uncharacterized protein LOC129308811 [Prosopis cineraria]